MKRINKKRGAIVVNLNYLINNVFDIDGRIQLSSSSLNLLVVCNLQKCNYCFGVNVVIVYDSNFVLKH